MTLTIYEELTEEMNKRMKTKFVYDMNCPACMRNMDIEVSEDFAGVDAGSIIEVRQPQERRHSLFEAILNVFIGLGVALLTQILVFPLFNIHIPFSHNLGIAGIFTFVSIIRSYGVRRLFNYLHVKEIL